MMMMIAESAPSPSCCPSVLFLLLRAVPAAAQAHDVEKLEEVADPYDGHPDEPHVPRDEHVLPGHCAEAEIGAEPDEECGARAARAPRSDGCFDRIHQRDQE